MEKAEQNLGYDFLYEDLNKVNIFSGSFEEYMNLSIDEQEKLYISYKSMRYDYKKYEDKGIYSGTFEEYAKLNDKELFNLYIKSYELEKKEFLELIEESYAKLKNCSESLFLMIKDSYKDFVESSNTYFDSEKLNIKMEASKIGLNVPDSLYQLVDTNINKPKFGLLDKKKYKVLDDLINDDYVFKLKTRQIESCFETEQDYNDKNKWMEFIDKKEEEYNALKANGYYDKSLENYLKEDTITTIKLTRLRKDKNYSKLDVVSKELENAIAESKKISEIEKATNREMEAIMNSSASQSLAYSAAKTIDKILGESQSKPISPTNININQSSLSGLSNGYRLSSGSGIKAETINRETEEERTFTAEEVEDILRRNASKR